MKKVIQKKIQIDNLGEELRVLYVAMTRAREKLILTGYLKSTEDIQGKEFSFYELLSAKSYLDYVLPAMVNRIGQASELVSEKCMIKQNGMSICIVSNTDLINQEFKKQLFQIKDKEDLLTFATDQIFDAKIREEIEEKMNYNYPFTKETEIKIKMTVTELKKLAGYQQEEESVPLFREFNTEEKLSEEVLKESANDNSIQDPTVPIFLQDKVTKITGVNRGSLYHKILERIDFTKIYNREDLELEIERITAEGCIKYDDLQKVNLNYIMTFMNSNIVTRMRNAQLLRQLYKEKQFVIGLPASEIMTGTDSKEIVLIQGIIDAFFEEEGELVLVDYKSDIAVTEIDLINRYQVQLKYYKKALEQILRKQVKDMIIYSLTLGKEIRINDESMGTL